MRHPTAKLSRIPYLKLHTLLLGSVGLLLAACGSESSTRGGGGGADVTRNTPAQIAQTSADDYDANINGLITGVTLKRWIANWERERPEGITGDLIILQASEGPQDRRYIRPNNVNVYTYVESGWQEPRFNGVTEVATSVVSGPSIDELIGTYGIDVEKDLIVCAQGAAETSSYFDQGLCWHSLRYWGVDHRHLAVLDGANAHLSGGWTATDFVAADFIPAIPGQPSPTNAIRNRSVGSVKRLRVDNTALQATLQDVIDALPTQDRNNTADAVFLWDARPVEEYSAGEATEAALPAVVPLADRYASVQNGASRQGHPRGSLNLNWQQLIDIETGRFKPKSALAAYLNGSVDAEGRGFIDGSYQPVGIGNAYRSGDVVVLWCETSARAAVAQIATAVILGLPTRLYGGGTIEWNSLTGGAVDRDGDPILPTDSRWRTDTVSAPVFANHPENIAPRNAWSNPQNPKLTAATVVTPRIVNPSAQRSNAVIAADKAYVGSADDGGSTVGGGGGGRPVLPPNPCS